MINFFPESKTVESFLRDSSSFINLGAFLAVSTVDSDFQEL